jgi:hypothetical protein
MGFDIPLIGFSESELAGLMPDDAIPEDAANEIPALPARSAAR